MIIIFWLKKVTFVSKLFCLLQFCELQQNREMEEFSEVSFILLKLISTRKEILDVYHWNFITFWTFSLGILPYYFLFQMFVEYLR